MLRKSKNNFHHLSSTMTSAFQIPLGRIKIHLEAIFQGISEHKVVDAEKWKRN